jgi:hypothetical protein
VAFGLELHLDPRGEATVRALRRALAAAGVPTPEGTAAAPGPGERPHLSLVRFDASDPAGAGRALAGFAAAEAPLELQLACLGVFTRPEVFVFLAPVVTEALLAFHRRAHAWAATVGAVHADPYVPGRWVPHSSLTLPLPPAQLPAALAVCQRIPFPLAVRGARIGMTHYPPVREWHSFELGTGLDAPPPPS